MKGGKDTKTLAKIQARRVFRVSDIRRNVLLKIIDQEICMETPCWYPPGWAPTWGTETSKNITEFWYKSVNLFLEELINIKVILFLIHELFR